ncbi:hypothetical protein CMI38_01065 [Candidatus Pacearchaeota archaeon]|jgi:hypothetical protein|nr:hypothetical protein [Candidatus Pacearchaeota archaeon]
MVDKVKNAVQIPWRQNTFVYPYKGLNDPQYIKDRDEIFAKNGNGWWWRWTKENTPIPGIYSPSSKEISITTVQKIDEVRRQRDEEAKALGIGEFIKCEMCGRETLKIHYKTKCCTKACSDKKYQIKAKRKRELKT